jgi:hypothetical protein
VQDSGLRNPSSEDGSKSIPADLSALVATNQYAPPQPSNTPAQGIDASTLVGSGLHRVHRLKLRSEVQALPL